MIRRAFTMRLKPDSLAEYRYHHDNIWPDLVAEIERAGIGSITTFQRDLDLFLISEIADEAAWDKLWNSEVHKRWAEVMQPLMHLRDDGIVDAGELAEVFHLTTSNRRGGGDGVGIAKGEAVARKPSSKKHKVPKASKNKSSHAKAHAPAKKSKKGAGKSKAKSAAKKKASNKKAKKHSGKRGAKNRRK